MKTIILFFFLSLIQVSTAQNSEEVEKALIGTWRGTGKHIYPTENDSIEYKYVGEELNNFVIDKKNIRLWLSSNNSPDNFFGKYKVVYDQKTKSHWIIVKKPFGNCTEKKMEIVSISDSLLIINSCINPIQVIYKKSPLPEQQIINVKELLEGKWIHAKSTAWQFNKLGKPTETIIKDTTLIVRSFFFKKDSVYIEIIDCEKIMVYEFKIQYEILLDKCVIELPEYKICVKPNMPRLLGVDYKVENSIQKMILFIDEETYPYQQYEKE